MNIWYDIKLAPKNGVPVLLWSKDFIDEDFNPSGTIDGYFDEQRGWTGAIWNGCQDVWDTVPYLEPTHFMLKVGLKE